jgi:hypothetical protein
MMADGTTICVTCHKRVPAESGLCQICGTTLEVRTLTNQPQEISPYWYGRSPYISLKFQPCPWESFMPSGKAA